MWKEWLWPNLRYYPIIFLERLRNITKTSVRIAGCWAEIWIWDLLNRKESSPLDDSFWWLHYVLWPFHVSHKLWVSSSTLLQDVSCGKVNSLGGHSISYSKQESVYVHGPIPNGFRDRDISLFSTQYRRATRHVLTRVAKCIDADGRIFENELH
jgi:hypothetical protein